MKAKVQTIVDRKAIRLSKTMNALQIMRTQKNLKDAQLHPYLDAAYSECVKEGTLTLLKRVLLHIGDVSRQHNYLKAKGVISPSGGAQERVTFRSVLRWWEKTLPEDFYSPSTMIQFVEFSVFENIFYNEIRTDRKTGRLISMEKMDFNVEKIAKFIVKVLRKEYPVSLNLVAKHLPKLDAATNRVTKKILKGKTPIFNWKTPNKAWVKLNGELVEPGKIISVKNGDEIRYPRAKQAITLHKQQWNDSLIKAIMFKMGWTTEQYKKFRSTQNTPEQLFSSKKILTMSKDNVMKVFDGLTASQRFRISKMLCFKNSLNQLEAKPKWGDVAKWFVEWENAQAIVADQFRKAEGAEKKAIGTKLKVKATGMQTIDLLNQLSKGNSAQEVDTTYEALMKRFDMQINVFPIVDGSASMTNHIPVDGYKDLTCMDVAFALGIIFSTQNPNPEFKNTFGWFSSDFKFVGTSKYVTSQVNRYVMPQTKPVKEYRVLSDKEPFSENFKRMMQANPGIIGSTNIGAAVEFFVNWQARTGQPVEELPKALLFITDNEGNMGMSPREFSQFAASIGWFPLFIFWGIKANAMSQYKGVPNCLFLGGFSENVLNQIILGIKEGSIEPETELWSIHDNPRYQFML